LARFFGTALGEAAIGVAAGIAGIAAVGGRNGRHGQRDRGGPRKSAGVSPCQPAQVSCCRGFLLAGPGLGGQDLAGQILPSGSSGALPGAMWAIWAIWREFGCRANDGAVWGSQIAGPPCIHWQPAVEKERDGGSQATTVRDRLLDTTTTSPNTIREGGSPLGFNHARAGHPRHCAAQSVRHSCPASCRNAGGHVALSGKKRCACASLRFGCPTIHPTDPVICPPL